jgi:charged multivesicular body protein 5
MATVSAMEIANKEMKKQYKNIDIDKIEVSPVDVAMTTSW